METLSTLNIDGTAIPVFRGELLGSSLMDFMKIVLDELGLVEQVHFIDIREKNDLINIDDEGSVLRAMYDPIYGAITISLGEIWETSLSETNKLRKKTLSLQAMLHFAFCETFLHECYHCQSHGAKGKEWIHDSEEKEAEEFAINWLCDMAKDHNLELPAAGDDGWFGERLTEWHELVKDSSEAHLKMFTDMHEKRIVWKDVYKDINFETMREYYRLIALDALDDAAWGASELVAVVPIQAPDTEATKPDVPEPPKEGPMDEFYSDEPVASFDDDIDPDNVLIDEPLFDPGIADTTLEYGDTAVVETPPAPPAEKPVEEPKVVHRDPENGAVKQPTITVDEQTVIAKEVVHRLFHHMFTKCGWTGETWDQSLVGTIMEPVLVDDVRNVRQVFMGMNTVDDGKFRRNVKITDHIKGDLQKSGAPKYELFLNANGKRVKRVIAPVNMRMQSDATKEMKEGKWIAWLMDGYKSANADSILFRLRFDPEHDTEVEWTRWPEK